MKFVVGKVDEIPPGGRKIVRIAGRSIGVFNVGGDFYAIRNRCPHQGAALCEGKLWGVLRSDVPGQFEYDGTKEIIACISHGWEFSLKTGQSWCDPQKLRVRAYQVSAEEPTAIGSEIPVADADIVKNPLIEAANPKLHDVRAAGATASSEAAAPPTDPAAAAAGEQSAEDPEAPAPGMVKGPYQVETFPVTVEGEYLYLVIDVVDVAAPTASTSGASR